MKRNRTANIAYMGLCLALALILSYVESLIPFNFGIPGIKLGLANLCVVILLYICGYREALTVDLLRVILAGFLFGNLSMIMYSLAGAAVSFICMALVHKTGRFGPMGVSLSGGVTHNIGQLIVAVFVLGTMRIVYYVPALIISGALTGALLGIITALVLPAIRKIKSGSEGI
ncbi:MAG: Gx transporter family protein [Lachnospiraceae bacterium]|nr:Gx transporter family protein [Lachnospiraceae bacterium]